MPPSLTQVLHFRQHKRLWICPVGIAPHLTHLARFTNITTLIFTNLATAAFQTTSLSDYFGSFVPNVRRLQLHFPITRPTSLVRAIILFTSAVDIEIHHPRWSIVEEEEGEEPVPGHQFPGRLGFTGTLLLHGFGEIWSRFFALLSAQPFRFHRMRLIRCEFDTSIPTQSLLGALSRTTRTLHLIGSGHRELGCESCGK